VKNGSARRIVKKTGTLKAHRREAKIAWAMLLVLGTALAVLLTVGGVQWLGEQLNTARNFKSELVTTVLGMGLVVIGPVLLLALVLTFPRWWLRAAAARLKKTLLYAVPGNDNARP